MAEMTLSLVEGLHFRGVAPSGHTIDIDSRPGGEPPLAAPSPMEYVLSAVGACTAMDVISILRKMRQDVTAYDVRLRGERATDHPRVFTRVEVTHCVSGNGVHEANVRRAIQLAITRYCPVFAMLYPGVEIAERYEIRDDASGALVSGTVAPDDDEVTLPAAGGG